MSELSVEEEEEEEEEEESELKASEEKLQTKITSAKRQKAMSKLAAKIQERNPNCK